MTIKTFSSTLHPTARLSDMLKNSQTPTPDIRCSEVASAATTVIRWLQDPQSADQYTIIRAIKTITLAEAGL